MVGHSRLEVGMRVRSVSTGALGTVRSMPEKRPGDQVRRIEVEWDNGQVTWAGENHVEPDHLSDRIAREREEPDARTRHGRARLKPAELTVDAPMARQREANLFSALSARVEKTVGSDHSSLGRAVLNAIWPLVHDALSENQGPVEKKVWRLTDDHAEVVVRVSADSVSLGCPWCGVEDQIVEMDEAVRFNEVADLNIVEVPDPSGPKREVLRVTLSPGRAGDWEHRSWWCQACEQDVEMHPAGDVRYQG